MNCDLKISWRNSGTTGNISRDFRLFDTMCGICFCLFVDSENSRSHYQIISDAILPHLQRRGPDHTKKKDCSIKNDHGKFCLSLVGTVLHLRGSKTPQPLEDRHGNILLWNGEIFGGIEVNEHENDSQVLLNALSNRSSQVTSCQHILSTMAKVQGPWAFVYWQASEQKLWFGRDYFGRRSLLWHLPSNPNDVLAVTSVSERNYTEADTKLHFEEVPADGLYCVDLVSNTAEQECEQPFRINKFEWKIASEELQTSVFLTSPVRTPFNKQLPTEQDFRVIEENRRIFRPRENKHDKNALKLEQMLCKEGKESARNGNSIEKTCGERDVEIERLKLDAVKNENAIEGNVSEHNETSLNCDSEFSVREKSLQDGVCGLHLNAKFSSPNPTFRGNFEASTSEMSSSSNSSLSHNVASEHSRPSCLETFSESTSANELSKSTSLPSTGTAAEICSPCNSLQSHWSAFYEESRDKFIEILGNAVCKRVWNLPRTCNNLVSSSFSSGSAFELNSSTSSGVQQKDARVGVLFSGGIDSMVIAALADKFVPTEEAIDLINVAFEQKLSSINPQNKNAKKGKMRKNIAPTKPARNFSVPDRITGISGLEELQRINPVRQWNFIEVNVTLEELQEMRSRHISHLVSPLNTVLDDSIGCALWFAARGVGHLRSSPVVKDNEEVKEEKTYTSRAKVLLVGMGADEQLGGYARHRTRLINEGWSGLMDEMEMEVKRISKRNLGRDDRCISDHGREARFPFLDEEVVSFLNSLPVWLKTDPGLLRGIGEKQLLRRAARLLGLTSSSELPKRAIQFGSRIAKLESAGEKGSETCSRLES